MQSSYTPWLAESRIHIAEMSPVTMKLQCIVHTQDTVMAGRRHSSTPGTDLSSSPGVTEDLNTVVSSCPTGPQQR
jgi:hypothetical protein